MLKFRVFSKIRKERSKIKKKTGKNEEKHQKVKVQIFSYMSVNMTNGKFVERTGTQ